MNPDAEATDEDRFAELLAAFDDRLARGAAAVDGSTGVETAGDATTLTALDEPTRERLRSLKSCLRMIETARRNCPDSLSDLTVREFDALANRDVGDCDANLPPFGDTWTESLRGTRIGQFRIEHELGRGGYGVVFLATDPDLDRPVALKIPHPEVLVTADLRRRFFREAKAAAQLSHANIIPVFEAGRAGAICYIAYDYCPGTSLEQWLHDQPGPVAPDVAAELIATLCDAVQHAHSRGILHRDLKPANVLIKREDASATCATDEGVYDNGGPVDRAIADGPNRLSQSLRIADFGLAKFLDTETSDTRTAAIVGTPAYMAPEQADGRHAAVGPAADVYALGAILYELLVGRPPFAKDGQLATLQAVRLEEPTPPARVRRDLPRDLEAICLKCLEKEPHRRYASGSELAADLHRFLAGESVLARRVSALERAARWCRRNPLVTLLVSTVAALLLVLAVGSTLAAVRFGWQREAARQTSLRATAAEGEARDARNLSQQRLYRALVEQARANRLSERPGQRFDSLAALGEALRLGLTESEDERLMLRNEAIACLMLPDLRPTQPWRIDTDGLRSGVAFDPDLVHYAVGENAGQTIVVRKLADNQEVARLRGQPLAGHDPQLRYSPDGKLLAGKFETRGNARIAVWAPPRPEPVFEAPAGGKWHDANFDFTTDSQALIVAENGGAIARYEARTGKRSHSTPGPATATALALHPKRPQAAVYRKGRVETIALDDGEVVKSAPWNTSIECLAFSPDGRSLAAADIVGRVLLWNAATMKLRFDAQPLMVNYLDNADINQTVHIAFSRRGDILASTGWDGTTRLWDPLNGASLLRTPGFAAQFSRDDRSLADGKFGPTVNRWSVTPRREYFVLAHDGQMTKIRTINVDPTGRLIGAATIRGVCVWDLASGEVAGFYPFDNSRGGVAYDSSGKQIVTNGPLGVHLWPVGWHEAPQRMDYWFGLPQSLPLPADFNRGPVAVSRKARRLATGMRNEPGTIFVSDLETHRIVRTFSGHSNLYFIDISPDGRWVATGTQHGRDVKVWEVDTGKVVATLSCRSASVAFSPDGRLLVVAGGQEYSFWSTNNWTCVHRLPRDNIGDLAGYVAFDAQGKVIAITDRLRSVTLADAVDLRTLATFSAPDAAIISSLTLSDDGGHLAAGMENGMVHVWNVRLIRDELKKLGLDWNLPPLQAPTAAWQKETVRIRTRLTENLHLSIPSY